MIHHRALRLLHFRRGRGILIGLAAGVGGFMLSLPLRTLFPGRFFGDPLPIMLTLNQIVRSGLIYLQWRPLLVHVLFLLLLVGLVWGSSIMFPRLDRQGAWFVRATRVAVLVNVLIAALFEVDSIMVGFWYFMSGFLSTTIAILIAGRIAGISHLQRS